MSIDRRRLARFTVAAIAVLIHLIAIAALGFSAWMVIRDFPSFTLLPGVVLLAFGVLLLPRPPGLPRYATRLRREDAPHLFAFVDTVAGAVGVPCPALIVLDDRFDADGATTGLLRRRYLRLGVPLFAVLDPGQRTALVAHQLAHFTTGNPLRSGLAGSADLSLANLAAMFEPRSDTALRAFQDEQIVKASLNTAGAGGMRVSGNVANVWYAEMLIRPFLWVLQQISSLGRRALVTLARPDVERAEFAADTVAARTAGSAAALEMLDMLALGEPVVTVLRRHIRATRSDTPDPATWQALAREIRGHATTADPPPFEGHPPITDRVRVLEAQPPLKPALSAATDAAEGVDAELATAYRRLARDLRYG
ncbi:M48 family metallopeptidase [Dactylosporangium sp. CS-047395]|uniref:M48 family metallopeptidase n=1 Tax=Dactylosporangium sp. CS-047395 TaxID=3239936 RepID=UPI003D916510